jgi:hypothetical protein
MLKTPIRRFVLLIAPAALFLFTSCAANNNTAGPTTTPTVANPSPTPVQTDFEKDLDYVRKGQYTYVLVFSRKDGKVLDKNDAAYLRTNAPQVVDWVTTDGGKKVIAGTNFDLEKGNMDLLKKRFVVEDVTSVQ